MPRSGLSKEQIFEASIQLVAKDSLEKLTIHNLAKKLGVKAPSLYNHIESLEELHHNLSKHVNAQMVAIFREAIQGKLGHEAIFAFSTAYREYAHNNPKLYKLSGNFPAADSDEWINILIPLRQIFQRLLHTELHIIEDDINCAARALRSYLHGFIEMELNGGWSKKGDINKSFQQGLEYLIAGMEKVNQQKISKKIN